MGHIVKQMVVAVSRRRTTADGSFDGTIHVATLPSYFTDFWSSLISHVPGARIALVRGDGRMLARIPADKFPATLPGSSPLLQSPPSTDTPAVFDTTSSLDGTHCIFIAAKVGTYPIYLTYGIPVASVIDRWLQHLMILAAICLLAALALAGTVLLAMHQANELQEEQARRAAAEKSAMEAQRLEVLGQLAAGVAHDFGNVVQAVDFSATVIVRGAIDEKVREAGQRIQQAARQGRWLTRRMLDFARDEDGAEEANTVLAPRETVSDIVKFLTTTLGAQYQLTCTMKPDGLPDLLRGDRNGLEGAIMNLVVNARDAMPNGGEVAIRVEAHRFNTRYDSTNLARLPPGVYAAISISDSGCGMAPDVLARVGEPFFTTKPRGRGTGLGLASARRYVRRNGGGFHIDSVQGRGTTVYLWLPDATAEAIAEAAPRVRRRA
ncbi:MAG TPA: ATP-binding protein [Rhodopila sp.]|nr:ATP-binding protein [Rhodopila sp.]